MSLSDKQYNLLIVVAIVLGSVLGTFGLMILASEATKIVTSSFSQLVH